MGIETINPFELPALNTVILLASGVTITYGHHSLIQGNRKGTLIGVVYTILLAIIFTALQGVEYTVSSFTISDGTYGSCFYFGTGFHGLIIYVALYIYTIIYLYKKNQNILITNNISTTLSNCNLKQDILTKLNLKKEFLEWLVGFTDGDGNFNIKVTNLKNNTFTSVQFTFQISLHKDEIKVLEYIKNNLKCGHISYSNNRINYFVNDINSLLYIIIPIFEFVNLNSSKHHHFLLF